jgi:preprotein translocase subunit YajC
MGAVLLIVILGGLFALLIVPRQREARRHQQLIASVHEGDEIMTGSGLYGRIVELEADYVQLEIAPGVVVKLARRAVLAKVDPPADTADEATIDVTDDASVDESPETDVDGLDVDADDPARHPER